MNPVSQAKTVTARMARWTGLATAGLLAQRVLHFPYVRVLNYHDVPEAEAGRFRAQLEWLSRTFVPATAAEFRAFIDSGTWHHRRPGVVLTFDDGLRSHAEVVAPALESLGFEGWFFTPVDRLTDDPSQQVPNAARYRIPHGSVDRGDGRVFLTPDQLRDLARRHVVGCHTASHVRLSADLDDARLTQEIDQAKRKLEALLGHAVDSFAWVGGEESSYSERAAEHIARNFRYSFSTNTRTARPGTSRLNIDRTQLEADYPHALAMLQISGLMDLLYARKRARLSRVLRPLEAPAPA